MGFRKGSTMKITVNIPFSDILTIKDICPAVVSAAFEGFQKKLTDFAKEYENNGIKTKTSFNIMTGFTFEFEASASTLVEGIENNINMDLRVLLEGYANSIIMMTGVIKASEEAFKMKRNKTEEKK